jgi:hypothetical protein
MENGKWKMENGEWNMKIMNWFIVNINNKF